MKKLDLEQMEKVNGGDCNGMKNRRDRSVASGRRYNTARLQRRIARKCA